MRITRGTCNENYRTLFGAVLSDRPARQRKLIYSKLVTNKFI